MLKGMSNKAIIDLYVMYLRWVASGIQTGKTITLLSDKEAALIEKAIKASTSSMSALERAALQGKIDGLTGAQIAKAARCNTTYTYQAINTAINKIDFTEAKEATFDETQI